MIERRREAARKKKEKINKRGNCGRRGKVNTIHKMERRRGE